MKMNHYELFKQTIKSNKWKAEIKIELTDFYHHGGKHGSMLADMVLEELRVLYLDPKAAKRGCVCHWV